MSKSSDYAEKFKDPRWQKRRLEIFDRDGWSCRECGDDSSNLQIHHLHYEWGRDPWDYPDSELITLCEVCHEVVTAQIREAKDLFSELLSADPAMLRFVLAFLKLCKAELFLAFHRDFELTFPLGDEVAFYQVAGIKYPEALGNDITPELLSKLTEDGCNASLANVIAKRIRKEAA